MNKDTPSKILISTLLPIGDTLFTTPAIHAIRAAYPQAHITLLGYTSNSGVVTANSDIDRIWHWPSRQSLKGPQELAQLFIAMRRARFDLLVRFSTYDYSFFLWAAAPRRTMLQLPLAWWLRPGAGREWRKYHAVQHFAWVVSRIGVPITDWRLRMEPTQKDVESVDAMLAQAGIGPEERLLGIHPGGEGLGGKKQWPVERFAVVADGLFQRFGARTVVMGGKDDKPLAEKLAQLASSPVTIMAGQTTLGETAALARRCAIFVGNDSSPLHIAAAMGTPVVGIYGPTDPNSYHPWIPGGKEGVDYAVVRPKDNSGCCYPLIGGITLPAMRRCTSVDWLQRIDAEQVLQAAAGLLEKRQTASQLQMTF